MEQGFPETQRVFNPSPHLFRPTDIGVEPLSPIATHRDLQTAGAVGSYLSSLITQKNYPCVAAVQALFKKDYRIGIYGELGRGSRNRELGQDLMYFLHEQRRTHSEYLSLVAVFPEISLPEAAGESPTDPETNFENKLWRELSFLTSQPEANDMVWDPDFSSDPRSPRFCFSWGGKAFFVVGIHGQSSRVARRFPFPALVFNVYDQFKQLAEDGRYAPMVKTNRRRDVAFQGSVNPMVEKYGETWEAIQFSGKENSSEWRCPFHHGLSPS